MWLFGGNSGDDEGMDLFIGNLPDKTSTYDVEQLLGDHVEDATLKFSNKLFTDGSAINFCVVAFRSRKRAEKAMKAMRLKKLGGEYLTVHEFNYRSYQNDRRENLHQNGLDSELREEERRRQEKVVDPFDPAPEVEESIDSSKIRVSGYNAFARKG
ncbi:MAG: RNA-binding protein [Chromatiales bacterium]|nr:RNA-binding protein [Chromatiales bacterium]